MSSYLWATWLQEIYSSAMHLPHGGTIPSQFPLSNKWKTPFCYVVEDEDEDEEKIMKLEGSCHCGAVKFVCESKHPVPYQLCYCGVCRKTAGGGGYAINLAGEANTLSVTGKENISVYQATIQNPEDSSPRVSSGRRSFCKQCGSMLWVDDPTWPQLIHPFASAVDTELPLPPERTHIMLAFKPSWVDVSGNAGDKMFPRYPDESIADWHRRLNLQC